MRRSGTSSGFAHIAGGFCPRSLDNCSIARLELTEYESRLVSVNETAPGTKGEL